MIQFFGESLVPPELCRLLYLTIPDDFHVPVVFRNNRRVGYFASGRGRASIGVTRYYDGVMWIEIDLNGVYGDVHGAGSRASLLWEALLKISYHEFGHVATAEQTENISEEAYRSDVDIHYWVEGLANEWKQQRLDLLLRHDPRLAQPRKLRGYFGARLSREMRRIARCQDGSSKASYVRERRCMKTGAQFTIGDALRRLGSWSWWSDEDPNLFQEEKDYERHHRRQQARARRLLRGLAADVGVEYRDASGRRHKLFQWGDLPILRARVADTAGVLPA